MRELNDFKFLLGNWKGKPTEHIPDDENITSFYTFTKEDHEKFIIGRHKSVSNNKIVNSSISTLLYDKTKNKFLRKSVFSYGFVNNETEYERNENSITFNIKVEPNPPMFAEIIWRSHIIKEEDDVVIMGLKKANKHDPENFEIYSEMQYIRNT